MPTAWHIPDAFVNVCFPGLEAGGETFKEVTISSVFLLFPPPPPSLLVKTPHRLSWGGGGGQQILHFHWPVLSLAVDGGVNSPGWRNGE